MHLGVTSWVWQHEPLAVAVAHAQRLGLRHMEVGAGGYFGKAHCNPEILLEDQQALKNFRALFAHHDMTISALAVHGEPLHPNPDVAEPYDRELRAAMILADRLEVETLTLLSGLPGASPDDPQPNWVTYPFPERNLDIIRWQWEARLVPYWRERARLAENVGVRLAFEIHPADMCYQPSRLMQLRAEIGPVIGANFDPSHLIWQSVDIPSAIHYLGNAIYNVHAKESAVNNRIARIDGVIESREWDREGERAWNFRTAGYTKSLTWWRGLITALRSVGYDGVLAYEHEDPLIDSIEGLEKGIAFLRGSVLEKPRAKLWYAE